MPKVLRIINRFNLGGPTYNVAYLSKFMEPEFETLLVGGSKDKSEDSSEHILDDLGLHPVLLPEMKRAINLKKDWKAYKELKKIIREFKPDIVHTHASKAGTLGRLAAISCKVPVIVHTFHGHVFHSYFGKIKTALFKNIERYLAYKSTCIIAISDKQKQELTAEHRICPPEKMIVIPLGFDLQRFREGKDEKRKDFKNTWGFQDDELLVMIIGRLVPVKNHILYLLALKRAITGCKRKIRGVIVGDGESRNAIESAAKNLNLSFRNGQVNGGEDVVFTSWIHRADWACAGADIIVLSSFNEGTPVSLIEAQAAGKPVLSTRTGGVENIVKENCTAFLANVDDPDDFCSKLLKLTQNDELRKSMGEQGWGQVGKKFHYTRLVEDMKILYRRLLHEHETPITIIFITLLLHLQDLTRVYA
ncbi:MAG: glycosyltransferase [Bacteroidia bacterium]